MKLQPSVIIEKITTNSLREIFPTD